jgi:hypothetical protein
LIFISFVIPDAAFGDPGLLRPLVLRLAGAIKAMVKPIISSVKIVDRFSVILAKAGIHSQMGRRLRGRDAGTGQDL